MNNNANELIKNLILKAEESLKEAQNISDRNNTPFYWTGPVYGMGGNYYPNNKVFCQSKKDAIKFIIESNKSSDEKIRLINNLDNYDFQNGLYFNGDYWLSSSNGEDYGWQASSNSC